MQIDINVERYSCRFLLSNNCMVQYLNNTAYVAYRIDKFKMLCRFEKKNETSQSLREYVKNYLKSDMNYITMYLKIIEIFHKI